MRNFRVKEGRWKDHGHLDITGLLSELGINSLKTYCHGDNDTILMLELLLGRHAVTWSKS